MDNWPVKQHTPNSPTCYFFLVIFLLFSPIVNLYIGFVTYCCSSFLLFAFPLSHSLSLSLVPSLSYLLFLNIYKIRIECWIALIALTTTSHHSVLCSFLALVYQVWLALSQLSSLCLSLFKTKSLLQSIVCFFAIFGSVLASDTSHSVQSIYLLSEPFILTDHNTQSPLFLPNLPVFFFCQHFHGLRYFVFIIFCSLIFLSAVYINLF